MSQCSRWDFGSGFNRLNVISYPEGKGRIRLCSSCWSTSWAERTLTWAGFEGSHTVGDALSAARVETDPVAEGSSDVCVVKRHHLQHLLDLRLDVRQQLFQSLSRSRLSVDAQ